MRPGLIVRLPATAELPVSWVLTDSAGRAEGAAVSGNPEAMAQASRGREVIALLPATAVLFARVTVPTRNRARLLQAIPFALEDQLSEDIERLHFAAGPHGSDGSVDVAVTSRDTLDAAIQYLTEQQVEANQIHSELQSLPCQEGGWSLLVESSHFLLRTGPRAGYAGDTENLSVMLEGALEEAAERPPEHLDVYCTPAFEPSLPASMPAPEWHVIADVTALLGENLDRASAIGLRTGAFAPIGSNRDRWRHWRLPAALVVVLLLLGAGRGWLEQFQLTRELQALESRVDQTFREVFPDSAIPPSQQASVMRTRLQRLEGGTDGPSREGLLELLAQTTRALTESGDITIDALGYRGGGLELELSAASLQDIERLQQQLSGTGLRADVQGGQSRGDRVRSRLRVEAVP